jgi:hypothetical protein
MTWLAVGGCFLVVIIVFAAIMRVIRPPRLEPVEMEFDLRAAKLPDEMATKAADLARTRHLANRRYSLRKSGSTKYSRLSKLLSSLRRRPW